MTYSSSMALNRQRYASRRNQNVIGFAQTDKRLGPISNTVVLIIMACVLGLLYLTQVTKTNAYGYTINGLERQQTQLKTEHDDLEVASARLQSLERVQNSASAKKLVSAAPSGTVQN